MKWTRSDFFKTLSLLPLGYSTKVLYDTGKSTPRVVSPSYSKYDPWIEIYPDNMRHNAREIYRATGRPVFAVIKNNGYGMGVVESAKILDPMDEIDSFGVVKLGEAFALKDAGIQKPVVLLNLCEGRELKEALKRGIIPMVYTGIGNEIEKTAYELGKPVEVEVKLDTGLGRLGVRWDEAVPYYEDLAERNGVKVRGSFITFTESETFDEEMIRRYNSLMTELEEKGLDHGARHAVSTTPIFRHPKAYFDKVRPGIGLYGIYPQPEVQREMDLMDLKPAFGLKCRVLQVKHLKKGESAGYGQAFIAEEDTWTATLPMGHADGWQRSAANCANVRINGTHYPVVASVSASHCIVNLGPNAKVETGDTAAIFDDKEGSRPSDINRACGTSVYDILMHLNPNLKRIYHKES